MRISVVLSFLIALAITCSIPTNKPEELVVVEQNWDEAQKLAEKYDLLILMDFYTDWCGPCKVFDAQLQNQEFADSLAAHYLVFKYDAEKKDSFNLALKHHVTSYPTYIVSTAKGDIINKQYGRFEETPESLAKFFQFLHQGVEGHEQKKYLTGITKDTLSFPQFYVEHLNREKKYEVKDWEAYWQEHANLQTETEFAVLLGLGGPESVYANLIRDRNAYEQRFGKADVYHALEYHCHQQLENAILSQDSNKFAAALTQAEQLFNAEDADRFIPEYKELFWVETERWDLIANQVKANLKAGNLSRNDLNRYAWKIQEYSNDLRADELALHWMDSLTQIDSSYAYLDTYAWLLYKDGQRQKALTTIQSCIRQGEKMGENMAFSKELETVLNSEI
ncbi:thioredoxin family protein [bacterium SCSIO 12741]|nr:thioredoxin family protein [bacterium SCSIO 12741]